MERIERDSWGSTTDWKAFTEKFGEKCGASAVRYRDIVSELKHREMRTGERISSYYAALVKIVEKFFRCQRSPARTALISAFFSAGFNNKSLADYVAKDKDGHTLEGALAAARQWEAFNGQKFGEDWGQAKVFKIEKDETVFEKALQDLRRIES